MATATATTIETKTYTLTLSEDEAKTLNVVANWVGGPPEKRRGHVENIKEALVSVGVPDGLYDKAAKGSIYLDY